MTDRERNPKWVLLTTREAAERLHVAPSTIRSWKKRGRIGPASFIPSRGPTRVQPLYRLSDLLAIHNPQEDR